MLGIQQLLNVVANVSKDTPVAVEINGAAYSIGVAEVRNGTLVLAAEDVSAKVPAKSAGKSGKAAQPAAPSPSAVDSDNIELK